MNSAKPLGQTECLLEFILISLSHNLSLKPRQAQQLLNQSNKLLSHICVKGIKGQFQMLINWLADIYSNWAKLLNLCLAEQTNIVMLLNVVKPTLLSKDEEVVHWGLRLYTKLSYELASNDLLFHVYQWTVKDSNSPLCYPLDGSFQQFLLSYQRQP